VWHELTRDLVAEGRLQIVGVALEQHPERTALYAQWKGYDFPIVWDPFGVTGNEVVPVITAVDEFGITRMTRLDPRRFDEQFIREFMDAEFQDDALAYEGVRPFDFDPESKEIVPGPGQSPRGALSLALASRSVAASRDRLGLGPGPVIDTATLRRWAESEGAPAEASFYLGVLHRMRADSPRRQPGDFQAAIDAWRTALAMRPNQYIWRRRIQQWGPRLDKPYAFYDWVETAFAEIRARGEVPVVPRIELTGSEVADRSRRIPGTGPDAVAPEPPDPKGLITRDDGELVRLETAVAMSTAKEGSNVRWPSGACRVHVRLEPGEGAKWDAATDPPVLWLDLPEGWLARSPRVEFPWFERRDGVALAYEGERTAWTADFGLSTAPMPIGPPPGDDDDADDDDADDDDGDDEDGAEGGGEGDGGPPPFATFAREIPGYVVYSVCLPDTGQCVFRRQDFTLTIDLPEPGPPPGDGDDDEPTDDEEARDRKR